MAKVKTDMSDVRFELSLTHEEAIVLREILWFTQLGQSDKGKIAYDLSTALDDAGFNPEKVTGWIDALGQGEIIDLENPEVGIYWK